MRGGSRRNKFQRTGRMKTSRDRKYASGLCPANFVFAATFAEDPVGYLLWTSCSSSVQVIFIASKCDSHSTESHITDSNKVIYSEQILLLPFISYTTFGCASSDDSSSGVERYHTKVPLKWEDLGESQQILLMPGRKCLTYTLEHKYRRAQLDHNLSQPSNCNDNIPLHLHSFPY